MSACRQCRSYRKDLQALVTACDEVVRYMDAVMKRPESHDRGKQIASALNKLEFAKDHANHFGLGRPLKRSPEPR